MKVSGLEYNPAVPLPDFKVGDLVRWKHECEKPLIPSPLVVYRSEETENSDGTLSVLSLVNGRPDIDVSLLHIEHITGTLTISN